MKTVEQKTQEIENYINKTSKHLFTNDDGIMFKIIPFEIQDKKYFAYINYSSSSFKFFIKQIRYGGDVLQSIKHYMLFPNGHKMRSIHNFKASRVAFEAIKEVLLTYTGDKTSEQTIQAKVQGILSEMQIQTV